MGQISVLGLGPSLSLYTSGLAIGVNDIWSKVKTDYLVCVDTKDRFTSERLKTINESNPLKFYSIFPLKDKPEVTDWSDRPDFQRIELQPDFPKYVCQINIPQLPKSLCSPFVACAIAYKYLQATEINVYGVDLLNHPHLDRDSCDRIKLHFHNLKIALIQNNCQLIIHGDGILKGV